MNKVFLLAGSNQGDRLSNLRTAATGLGTYCGPISKMSSIYETAAWGNPNQESFLNCVFLVDTLLEPASVLQFCKSIEKAAGRAITKQWGPRTLDIDILFCNTDIIATKDLQIPHPLMHLRMFTLVPLAEIAPGYIHPKLGQTALELLKACKDQLPVKLVTPPFADL